MTRIVAIALVAVTVSGCAVDRYRRNLTHVYVTPWTHLSRADREAIVRLISDRDPQPIIGISAHPPRKDGSTVSVYTGDQHQTTYKLWHGYDLAKKGGTWQVTFHGECSHTIASLDLSGQMRQVQGERRR